MAYSDIEMLTRDIDWYIFDADNIPIHFASAGGILPSDINEFSIQNEYNKETISRFPDIFSKTQIVINPDLDYIIGDSFDHNMESKIPPLDYYIDSFISIAQKGFVSFDKTFIHKPYDSTYHFVASPPPFWSQLINKADYSHLYKLQSNVKLNLTMSPFDMAYLLQTIKSNPPLNEWSR